MMMWGGGVMMVVVVVVVAAVVVVVVMVLVLVVVVVMMGGDGHMLPSMFPRWVMGGEGTGVGREWQRRRRLIALRESRGLCN